MTWAEEVKGLALMRKIEDSGRVTTGALARTGVEESFDVDESIDTMDRDMGWGLCVLSSEMCL